MLDDEPEHWKPVRNYPGFSVSDYGRVKGPEGDIKSRRNSKGEPEVRFSYFEQTWQGPVWRLVLLTFFEVEIRDWRDIVIDYRDGHPDHLHVFNLTWSRTDGTPLIFRREPDASWVRVRKYAKKVRVVDTGEVFESAKALADSWGVNLNAAYMTLRGTQKTLRGHELEYFE